MNFINNLRLPIPARSAAAPAVAPSLGARIAQLATHSGPPMSEGAPSSRLNGMAGVPATELDALMGAAPSAQSPMPGANAQAIAREKAAEAAQPPTAHGLRGSAAPGGSPSMPGVMDTPLLSGGSGQPGVSAPPAALVGGGMTAIQPPTSPGDTVPGDGLSTPRAGVLPSMPAGLSARAPAAAQPLDGGPSATPSIGAGDPGQGMLAKLLAVAHGGTAAPDDGNPNAI